MVSGLASGCSVVGGDTLKKIEAGDPVRLGMSNEPPFAFKDSAGTVTGEAVVIYSGILEALGAAEDQVETKIVDWNSLIPGLRAGDYDLITAGMFINALRCERAIFSEPDYVTATTLLVPSGNPNKLKDFSSFTGGKYMLGLLAGGAEGELASDAGVPTETTKELPNNNELKSALSNGQIDAVALTAPALNYLAKTSGGEFETVTPFGEKSGGGAAFRDDDANFRDAVDQELAQIKSTEDKWLDVVAKFGFTANEYPSKKFTTAKLCKV